MHKKILIIIENSNNKNYIQIFDNNNRLIEKAFTKNKYTFKGEKNKVYKIKIINKNICFNSSFYITDYYDEPYIFNIRQTNLSHQIFIKLIDQNYNGLKIEKGRIYFGKQI